MAPNKLQFNPKAETLRTFLAKYYQRFEQPTFKRSLAALWVVITLFFAAQLPGLKANFEFEKFFPTGDPELAFYERHLEVFGYDNDYLLIILKREDGVFDSTFLSRLSLLTDSIQKLPGTQEVIAPVTMEFAITGPTGPVSFPLIHRHDPSRYASDSSRIFSHPLFITFFAPSGKSLLVHVTHDHFQESSASSLYANQIARLAAEYQLTDVRIIGKIVAQDEFIRLIREEFGLFLAGALALSMGLLLLIFRSLRTMLLPYAVSVSSLIWLLGGMALFDLPITILGSLIPPVILFVSTSDSIHLISSFRLQTNASFSSRIQLAVQKVLIPTFLTSVTTAIGFFSLITINTEPIQMLGLITAIGVLITFLITFAFGPLLLTTTAAHSQAQTTFPRRLAITMLRNPKVIFSTMGLICLLSVFGLYQLKTDAYLLKDLPEDAEVRQNFAYVDTNYGGSKPWEMAIWPAKGQNSIWEPSVMKEAQKIHHYLQNEFPIERLVSPVSFVHYGHQMNTGGEPDAFRFPEEEDYPKAIHNARMLAQRADLPKVLSRDEMYGRFAGFIPEYGSRETIQRNKHLQAFLAREVDPTILGYQLTGTTYLIDKSHDLLTTNLLKGLLIAIGLVGIVLGLYFKSIKILIISIIPNLIPLLIAGGYMGFSEIHLQLTTSIIFAVAFGIAVDDTIHFMTAYRQHQATNRVWRLIKTYRTTGRAMVITTLALVAGFTLFLLSGFGATWFLGLFLSIALIAALTVDLTFLPLLMHFWTKTKT